MKVQAFVLLALFATTFAFPNVEEFEIVEDELDEVEEVAEEIVEENRLFDLISQIEPKPKKATRLTSFSYKDCGGKNAMVNIKSVSITPDPIVLPGDMYVSTDFKINSDVGVSTDTLKGTVLLYKEVLGKFVKIPCVGMIGSCQYDDLCDLMEQIPECPDAITAIGINCLCPLKANSYSLKKADFDLSSLNIPAGTYHALGNATMTKTQAACLDITLTFK